MTPARVVLRPRRARPFYGRHPWVYAGAVAAVSGSTADRDDRWLVLQFTSLGMAQRRELFAELLGELARPRGMYLRTERGIGRLEGLELQDGPLWGELPDGPVEIEEDGIRFLVHVAE